MQRSMVSWTASLALHGGALGVAWLMGARAVESPSPTAASAPALTDIEIASPPPPPPPLPLAPPPPSFPVRGHDRPAPPATRSGPPAAAGSSARIRRGHEGHKQSLTLAPAIADPYADLEVSYDEPRGPDLGDRAGEASVGLGAALSGTGLGAGGGDATVAGGLEPPAPPASHAAPARPRMYWSYWRFQGARWLTGTEFRIELIIDARGRVRDVRIIDHVNPWIDEQAIALGRKFVFDPALDDSGRPVESRYPWLIKVVR